MNFERRDKMMARHKIMNQNFITTFLVIPLRKNFQKMKASPHQGNWSSHMHLHVHHYKCDQFHHLGSWPFLHIFACTILVTHDHQKIWMAWIKSYQVKLWITLVHYATPMNFITTVPDQFSSIFSSHYFA